MFIDISWRLTLYIIIVQNSRW